MMAVSVDPETGCVLRTRFRTQPPSTPPPSMWKAPVCDSPEIAILVPAFIASTLSPKDWVAVRNHINLCQVCMDKVRNPEKQREN